MVINDPPAVFEQDPEAANVTAPEPLPPELPTVNDVP
jgi:hypothetical protein